MPKPSDHLGDPEEPTVKQTLLAAGVAIAGPLSLFAAVVALLKELLR